MKQGEVGGPVVVKKGEFARLRGCAPSYVTKLCQSPAGGRPAGALFNTAALLPDGRINVALAEQVLGPAVPTQAAMRRLESERQGRGGPAHHTHGGEAVDAPALPLALALPATAAGARILDDKARRERAQADLAEMDAAKMRGELVPTAEVEGANFDVWRRVRDALAAVMRRTPERLAEMTDPRAIEAYLGGELDAALHEAVDELGERAAAAQAEALRLEAVAA